MINFIIGLLLSILITWLVFIISTWVDDNLESDSKITLFKSMMQTHKIIWNNFKFFLFRLF
jgi:hypothetical protein